VAISRNDFAAAANLLGRAARLPPVPALRRARLLVEHASTLMEAGKLAQAGAVLDEAASLTDDGCVQARLLVERQWLQFWRAAAGATKGASAVTRKVVPTLERADDHRGLWRAWELQGSADFYLGRVSSAAEAWEQAAEHARLAGMAHRRAEMLTWVAVSTWTGATPVDAGIRRCEEILEEVRGHLASEAEVLRPIGGLNGFAGRFELARSQFATRNTKLDELGRGLYYAPSNTEACVEMLAGDFPAAERWLRRGYDALEAMGENGVRSTTAALLARAVLGQGRIDEAERFTEVAEELGEPDDLLTQIVWRSVRARVASARGSFDEAERLAREAVELGRETDFVNFLADALIDLAAVLDDAARGTETSPLIEEAVRLYEEKGNTVSADAARARLDALAAV
jgi:tetratricopeptide (TPR) repeat protein